MIFRLLVLAVSLLLLAQAPVDPGAGSSQPNGAEPPYRIDDLRVHSAIRERQGKAERYVTVEFTVKRTSDGEPVADIGKDELKVLEDGLAVNDLEIYQPSTQDPLTAVLTLDISGSMNDRIKADQATKMDQARKAASTFLDLLHDKVDCGLILFNHEILQPTIPPIRDPKRYLENRQVVRQRIVTVQASGATAYLDAAAEAIRMLKDVQGRRAVLLMTDGLDTNSKTSIEEVIKEAQDARVPIYTLGVGQPGKKEPVTSVLVLDCSGSMNDRADQRDQVTKIEALRESASRFFDLMRPDAQTAVVPFNEKVMLLSDFTKDKAQLKEAVQKLEADGETALFDAILGALQTLEENKPTGKKAIIALTDGVDNRSRYKVNQVIEQSKRLKVPLYLLGLGRVDVNPPEIDQPVMRKMAEASGGAYYHARNRQSLFEIFENLSIQLHDDGIDEDTLKQLASQSGGTYKQAREVSELQPIYRKLAEELQSTYTVTFTSRRASHDGTARGIDISVWRNGVPLSDVAMASYNVHGVVVPEMSGGVYLGFLILLGGLLALPAGIKLLYRFYGGA
ncbi:MAG: vWA domain-containing protein [Gemmataceae bacterium]